MPRDVSLSDSKCWNGGHKLQDREKRGDLDGSPIGIHPGPILELIKQEFQTKRELIEVMPNQFSTSVTLILHQKRRHNYVN